jgi:2-polyprenyl-6-methoxyphenol hydroxylase-like FAD-dependent oxidoreductase
MLKNKKILIVGAGITGITLANILSKNNNIVLM